MRQQIFQFIDEPAISGQDGQDEQAGWDRARRDEVSRLMTECISAVARGGRRDANVSAKHEVREIAGSEEASNG